MKQTKRARISGGIEKVVRADGANYSVHARATLQIPHGDAYIMHRIESPGLHDIDVDSYTDPYLDVVFKEEKAILRDMLRVLGVK